MDNLIPIENTTSLLRDPETNSIINNSKTQYKNYIRLKEQKEKEKEKNLLLEEEISKMKTDLEDIKSLLRRMIDESK